MSANRLAVALIALVVAVLAAIGLQKCDSMTPTAVEAVQEPSDVTDASTTSTDESAEPSPEVTEVTVVVVEEVVVPEPTEPETTEPEAVEPEVVPAPVEPVAQVIEAEQVTEPEKAEETDDLTSALMAVRDGGGVYSDAKKTLVEAGWVPREFADGQRVDAIDEHENSLMEAGFSELESCEGESRLICRFEYVDGEGGIAAILTTGTEIDPRVIDAFSMMTK